MVRQILDWERKRYIMRRYKGLMLAGVICIACSMSACQRTVKDETRTTDSIISENADEHITYG